MKPQCETTADCLEQLARVMREFGFDTIASAFNSGYVLRRDEINTDYSDLSFGVPQVWAFAIAKLEDKPVFLGDIMYDSTGIKYTVMYAKDNEKIWAPDNTPFLYGTSEKGHVYFCQLSNAVGFTWTPPKQTVSIKIGDNEPVEVPIGITVMPAFGDSRGVFVQCKTPEAAEQFRKAMKPLVKEKS